MPLLQAILFAAAPLIALTNPLAEIPLFMAIVRGQSPAEATRAAFRVAVGVWVVLLISAIGGLQILSLLGIELSALRSAGGLLLVVMGLEMIQGRDPTLQSSRSSAEERQDELWQSMWAPGSEPHATDSSEPGTDIDEALWVPLVMPMLAGPGAIVATVSLTVRETLYVAWVPVATSVAVTLAAALVFVALAMAARISAYLHRRGTRILTRFSGLILVAIGFQMGFTGIRDFFFP